MVIPEKYPSNIIGISIIKQITTEYRKNLMKEIFFAPALIRPAEDIGGVILIIVKARKRFLSRR